MGVAAEVALAARDSEAIGVPQLGCGGSIGKGFPPKTAKPYTEQPKRIREKKGRREKFSGALHSVAD